MHSFVLLSCSNSFNLEPVVVKISTANNPNVVAAYKGSTSNKIPSALSLCRETNVLDVRIPFMLRRKWHRILS